MADLNAAAAAADTLDRIREAIKLYIAKCRNAAIDAAIVHGYTRMPPEENFGAMAAARASIEAEPWDSPA